MGKAESSEVDAALFGSVDGIKDALRDIGEEDIFVVGCAWGDEGVLEVIGFAFWWF